MSPAAVSVVIPAFNEAAYLGPTLGAVQRSFAALPPDRAVVPEIVVVDNGSDDGTAEVARALGATVVSEPVRSVARARNAGARVASGGMLVFLDADTLVPLNFAGKLMECAADPACLGGAFDTEHRPARAAVRVYLGFWRLIGLALLICAAGHPALSQAPASPGSVFRVTVDLVQVDAVVTDSKGRHVADLRPSDFQFLVDGKPRQLTNRPTLRTRRSIAA